MSSSASMSRKTPTASSQQPAGGQRGQRKVIVEVTQRRHSPLIPAVIDDLIWQHYLSALPPAPDGSLAPSCVHFAEPSGAAVLSGDAQQDATLPTHIETIAVSPSGCVALPLSRGADAVRILIYRLIEGARAPMPPCSADGSPNSHDGSRDSGGGGAGGGGDESGDTDAGRSTQHSMLPAREFHGLWESLHFPAGVKENLLNFVETSMLFAARKINPHIINCNRLVLLHGPPGTGKTSLCKAIAQKLAIRCMHRYRFTHLIEINSHSLFSKWFSESGKLVMRLFDHIRRILEHDSSLVCLLIDEVESLAFARDSVSASEPSDSLRVVNALLTQLDQVRSHPNVLVLTTSNLTGSIDVAFVDRADIKQYVGPPTVEAIFAIYVSAVEELVRVGIVRGDEGGLPTWELAQRAAGADGDDVAWATRRAANSRLMRRLAEESAGMSGRTLRKLPFLAHALYLVEDVAETEVSLEAYLAALQSAIGKRAVEQAQLNGDAAAAENGTKAAAAAAAGGRKRNGSDGHVDTILSSFVQVD